MYEPAEIAEKIKMLCKNKKVAIKEMLDHCGLSKNTMSSMLSGGSTPKSENLAKIADYLGCSVDYLLGRASDPEPTPKSPLDQALEGIDFALFGEVKDLTDAEKQDIINFIKFTKSQRKPE